MNNLTLKDFCKKFADFYESEHGFGAQEKIIDLGLDRVVIDDDIIEIYLQRPGLLIGKKCSNIEKIRLLFPDHYIKIIETDNVTYKIINHLNNRCAHCGSVITQDKKIESYSKEDYKFCSYECLNKWY